jgi:hypothetical protein
MASNTKTKTKSESEHEPATATAAGDTVTVSTTAPRHEITLAEPTVSGPPAPVAGHSAGQPVKGSYANLGAALSAAQGMVSGVEKDKKNTFHKYAYASAEALIAEGKAALSKCGLALVPIRVAIQGGDLHRQFLLLHSSGESLPLEVVWPIVEEKGRPIDKATSIASTSSLGYLLRDLLLMPRVDEEPDARGEHVPVQSARGKPAAEAPTPALAKNGNGNGNGKQPAPAEQPAELSADMLAKLAKTRTTLYLAMGLGEADKDQRAAIWADLLSPYKVKSAKELTPGQADAVLVALAGRITDADRKRPVAEDRQADIF